MIRPLGVYESERKREAIAALGRLLQQVMEEERNQCGLTWSEEQAAVALLCRLRVSRFAGN